MRIICDLDNTIFDTAKAMFTYYQEKYNDYSIKYDESKISWNMEKLISLSAAEVNKFFDEKEFFKHLKPYSNAIEVLTELSKHHELELVSLHSCEGMAYKYEFIRENLPMFNRVALFPLGDKFDKSMCSCDIAIDDRIDCLDSIDAKHKLLFGNYLWQNETNINKTFIRVYNWQELYNVVDKINRGENIER